MMTEILKHVGELKGRVMNLTNMITRGKSRAELDRLSAETADLRRREREMYEEIGRQAYALDAQVWDADGRMKCIKESIEESEARFNAAVAEREAARRAKAAAKKANLCSACGRVNPKDMKFCQNCGAKLSARMTCASCGKDIAPDTRFCGFCGAKRTEGEGAAQC